MIDEEMAEDYANEYVPLIAPIDDKFYILTKEDIVKILRDCSIDSYLDGLKAGRPKWHKVTDGDFPKRDERFTANVSVPVMIQDNAFACYCYDDKQWYSRGIVLSNVIAWCEIPKFEEEN